jgi:phage shock protein E
VTLRSTMFLAVLALAVPWGARAAEQGPKADGKEVAGIAPGVVDGPTARKLVASGVKVVDVRTPGEFAAGHVPGAVNIPYDEMAKRYGEVGSPSTPVLLYCKTGRRSGMAGATLREKGFTSLYDMQSYDRWTESEPKR